MRLLFFETRNINGHGFFIFRKTKLRQKNHLPNDYMGKESKFSVYRIKAAIVLILVLFSAMKLEAKDRINEEVNSSLGQIATLKVYFQGGNIDFDYIRRNIEFVDFVNDPAASDVHIIVTRNSTGSGGTNYLLNFYSKTITQIGDITLNCISSPGDTENAIRECITRALKLGLMPYMNETTNSQQIDIRYSTPDGEQKKPIATVDPWKKWVFRMDTNGGFSLEESIKKYNYSFNVRADKIADQIKMKNSFYMSNRFQEVDTDEGLLTSLSQFKNAATETVYSLSKRWSAGMFVSVFQSTYWNTQHSFDVKPAIEYNFFPWEDADKRVFTVAYFAGIEMKEYYETTIFGKMDENLWAHNLKLNFELIQPWGEIETRLEGSSYLQDMTKNSISFASDLSLRISRGLSFNMGFRAENVHNQLYLPAQEVSLEDILMGNQKLPSTFGVSGGVGLRFQFGSLYNNVVNNRL